MLQRGFFGALVVLLWWQWQFQGGSFGFGGGGFLAVSAKTRMVAALGFFVVGGMVEG